MISIRNTVTLSALALALAACGDEVDVEEPVVSSGLTDAELDTAVEFDPMGRDYTLSADQQAQRDAFDTDAFVVEYWTIRDEIGEEQVEMVEGADSMNASDSGADSGDDAAAGSGTMSETGDAEMEAAAQPRDPETNMRARANMTFAYLDRNDDGQLSVAEYAIWAVPVSPANETASDQGQPELTANAINGAADSFFYYDTDGDTYLDDAEFAAARSGATV